jgi:quinoprotein glucose dehydrogenase
MPGEQAWPTQPFPTAPPPFARQRMTADDVNPFLLTPDERAEWKARISRMRNEGLFTPPGLEETISLPGARGGSNWGTSASNPARGLVYLTTQDWPTIYKLSLEDPLAARRRPAAASPAEGRAIYEDRCQSCHGANGAGSAGGPPPVAGAHRMAWDAFRQIVAAGRGKMPAFTDIDDPALNAVYGFLETGNDVDRNAAADSANDRSTPGPVVASGGAPGGLAARPVTGRYTPLGGPDYPAGVSAPRDRYYTDWGLYPDKPYIIGPPWAAMVAYDLNTGTIKWRVPLGEDARAAQEGAKDAGAFMAERHGIIVTATGLLFVATSDGKVRAHDEETGRVLWTAPLPAGSEGIPAMYEVKGRQFLVVPASSRINTGGGHQMPGAPPAPDTRGPLAGYVAFALPEN